MKKLAVVLMAVGLFGTMPIFAAEIDKAKDGPDERILQCVYQSESIHQKIQRIQNEIKKGSTKYSAEELKRLQDKLEEANKVLDELYSP